MRIGSSNEGDGALGFASFRPLVKACRSGWPTPAEGGSKVQATQPGGTAKGYEAPCINCPTNTHRLIRLSVDNTVSGPSCSCVGLQGGVLGPKRDDIAHVSVDKTLDKSVDKSVSVTDNPL